MIISTCNLDKLNFENENARILFTHAITEHPNTILDLFELIEITESLALEIWELVNK